MSFLIKLLRIVGPADHFAKFVFSHTGGVWPGRSAGAVQHVSGDLVEVVLVGRVRQLGGDPVVNLRL